jgi:hypothetical protein
MWRFSCLKHAPEHCQLKVRVCDRVCRPSAEGARRGRQSFASTQVFGQPLRAEKSNGGSHRRGRLRRSPRALACCRRRRERSGVHTAGASELAAMPAWRRGRGLSVGEFPAQAIEGADDLTAREMGLRGNCSFFLG